MPITTRDPSRYGGDKDHFRHVYDELFAPAIERAGFQPVPPAASGSEVIQSRLISQLVSSDIVLCDLSSLNPNVLFELGVRTALNKPVALTSEEGTEFARIFDLQPNHIHEYKSDLLAHVVRDEIPKLERHITTAAEISEGKNMMWGTFSVEARAILDRSADPETALLGRIESLQHQVANIMTLLVRPDHDHLEEADQWRLSRQRLRDYLTTKLPSGLEVMGYGPDPMRTDRTIEVLLNRDPDASERDAIEGFMLEMPRPAYLRGPTVSIAYPRRFA